MARKLFFRRPASDLTVAAELILMVLVATCYCGMTIQPALAQTPDPSPVRPLIESYQMTWNTHDASTLADFFTEEADLVMGNQPRQRGRSAVEGWWRGYFANQEPGRKLTIEVTSLQFLQDGVAVVNVHTTTGGVDALHRKLPSRTARGTWVVSRQSGEWLISAMRGFPTERDRVVLNPSLETAESLRPHIRALVEDYAEAFNRHDASALSSFYRKDADLIVRNGARIYGEEAIRDWWVAYFSQPRPYRAFLIIDEIRMLSPNIALLSITATGEPREAQAELTPIRSAPATWLIVREAGKWRIAALRVLPGQSDQIIRKIDR